MNIQLQELNKGTHIANTLKGHLNSQQKTNALWLVTTIKAILNTPIKIFVNPIFLFRKTHEAAFRTSTILPAFNGDLGAAIAAQKDNPVNYGSEFCDTAALAKLLFYHVDRAKIINIIQQGYCYHLDPIK